MRPRKQAGVGRRQQFSLEECVSANLENGWRGGLAKISRTAPADGLECCVLHRLCLRLERGFLYKVIRLFRIRSASESVARGFALGLIVNFFPTFGFGVVISGFVARLFGGNAVAGLIGGATLTFAWPVLFYLNMRVGSLFRRPSIIVDELSDVTEKTISMLAWGKTFTIGAVVNSVLIGLATYLLLRLLYERVRPAALSYFRRHAKDHQQRFRRPDRG
jgi:uncharacterized protein